MNEFEIFSQLHFNDTPLVIGNAWNAGSAKVFEESGFKAIATSSAAIADSMGYEDGQHIPFGLLLETVKRIKKSISLPLSVDMERGYANTLTGILKNVEKLYDAGIAGINIEDSTPGLKMRTTESFQKIISGIANHVGRKNIQLFINARTDAFLLKLPNALDETLLRAKAYEAAGANGLFVPFINSITDIKKIVAGISLPLNVLVTRQLPDLKTLEKAGVKRISMGNTIYNHLENTMRKKMGILLQEQTVAGLF